MQYITSMISPEHTKHQTHNIITQNLNQSHIKETVEAAYIWLSDSRGSPSPDNMNREYLIYLYKKTQIQIWIF